MSYFGKEFTLDTQEGFEAFLDSLGDKIPADMKKVVLAHKGTAKLLKNGDDEYTLVTSKPTGGLKENTFKSGVEVDDELGGAKAKTTSTMSGDTLITAMKFENGVTFTITREFSDSQLVATIKTSLGVGAKRIYKP